MSSLTIRPSAATDRRDAVESRVFDAVEELLAEGHSFVELSVAAIAERAGVARSTFYVHFADKTELLVRLARTTTEDIFLAAHEWISADPEVIAGGGLDALTATCARIVADYRRHARVLQAVLAATGYDPAVERYWVGRIDAFVEVAGERIERAQTAGFVPADSDPHLLATMAAWSIERTVSRVVAASPADRDPDLSRTLARSLWLMVFGDPTLAG